MSTTCWLWVRPNRRKRCCRNSRRIWQCVGACDLDAARVSGSVFELDSTSVHLRSCDYVTQMCKDFGFGDLKGSNNLTFEKPWESDTVLDDAGKRRHSQVAWFVTLVGSCQVSTHVEAGSTRNEVNIKCLLRYLVGNLVCNKVVG